MSPLAVAVASAGAANPRDQAHAILQERRFHPADVPRPLARPLEWLGRVLQDAFDTVASWLPGGSITLWIILAVVVLALAPLLTLRAVRRRSVRARGLDASEEADGRPEDPARLEREAERAARAGDYELALRLRFRAGLGRLAARRIIAPRASLTSGEIGRRLRSPAYDEVAASFEEVVYGGRTARADDVELARRRWPAVLAEAGRR